MGEEAMGGIETTSNDRDHFTLRKLTKSFNGKQGAHIIYMFNEQEKYFANAYDFISDGLVDGDKILLVEDQTFYYTITNKLRDNGFSEEEVRAIIFVPTSSFYLGNMGFNADRNLKNLEDVLKEHIDSGERARTWGHVIVDDSILCEIRRYESECDTFMHGKNMISVCAYNAITTPSYFQNELLKVHEYFMIDDQIDKSPFYHKKHVSFSNFDRGRLHALQKENATLIEKNQRLLIEKARQKEREEYLKLDKINAEKSNRAKSLFLSQMSHDLRTPLNTIQGYSQIILMNENNDDQLKAKINKIYAASEQLLNLIEEVLDFTVNDAASLNLNIRKVQLKSFLEDCVGSLFEVNTSDINIQLESIPEDIFIEVDPVRFYQIITNLLNNAIKYNTPKGMVKIYCLLDEKSEEVIIHVKDTGVGVDPKELDLIFEPFYRSGNSMGRGNGLGLAIVAQLTKVMNGKFGVISEEQKGSIFWVSFKRAYAKRQTIFNQSHYKGISNLSKAIRVIYVEDNQDNIDVMSYMTDLMGGIELICVTSGKEGLDLAVQLLPDLILLDMSLPDINGYEVVMRLKSDSKTTNIPVIAVSADTMATTIERALNHGCIDYITKPINYEKLVKALDIDLN